MSELLLLEFTGVTEDHYRAVNAALGVDMATGGGDWPEGLRRHAAGFTDDGRFVVAEVWDSRAHQEAFLHGRLGSALGASGINAMPQATWVSLLTNLDIR